MRAWLAPTSGACHGTPDASDPDYGEIIYDKGSGSMGSYDPFDESRW